MKAVDAFIDGLPPDKAVLVNRVRELLHELVPEIVEKLSFKIPFYHYHGMFCYINPTEKGIDLGFCRGKDLTEEFPQLQLKERAIIATVLIQSVRDFEKLQLRELITAAAIWNEEARRLKIPMVAKKKTKAAKKKSKK
jgi:hypothetical protein